MTTYKQIPYELNFAKKAPVFFKKSLQKSKDFTVQPNSDVMIKVYQVCASEFKVQFTLLNVFSEQIDIIRPCGGTYGAYEWDYEQAWNSLCASAQKVWNRLMNAVLPHISIEKQEVEE